MEHILAMAGLQPPDYQSNNAWLLPIPATFIVDRAGVVAARFVDPDYCKRMAIEDLLAALKAAAQGRLRAS
jgi:hypothetical protein